MNLKVPMFHSRDDWRAAGGEKARSQANRFWRFPAGALKSALWELSFSALCQRHAHAHFGQRRALPRAAKHTQKLDVDRKEAKRSKKSDCGAEQLIKQRETTVRLMRQTLLWQ